MGTCRRDKLAAYNLPVRGFSVVELVVTTTIIVMGLLGISSLVIQNLQVENVNKNQLVASMLAQEGLELVRNIRDENWLSETNAWNQDITFYNINTPYANNDFAIDYRGRDEIIDADGITDTDAKLYMDNNDLYTHDDSNSTTTPFARVITIVNSASKIEAGAVVTWNAQGRVFNYTASTTLYDWR
jgi:Tfp pilus assembly protein PilV